MTEHNKRVHPEALYSAEAVRNMDQYAIETLGIPGIELMNRAGRAAFDFLRQRWPEARFISVLCGSGNNGGDGYILARLALEAGLDVRVYPTAPPLKGDALTASEAYRAAGGEILGFIPAEFESAEVLVDGLLGTGLDREVDGRYAEIIRAVNRFRGTGRVLALDIPSGLNADTGAAMGVAVKADATVSFIGLKQGLFTGEGLEYAGDVIFDDLDTPPEVRQAATPTAKLLRPLQRGLPPRPRYAHKGHFGHVLVIGGDHGYAGAARMAGEAALRVGAGLVSIATRAVHAPLLGLNRPELMCHGTESREELESLLARATVLAIGPGLSRSNWGRSMLDTALESGLPLVMDADALNLLAELPWRRDGWILTPHPGEAARLLGSSSAAVQRDRYAAALELQARYGGTVVLKGSGTLIAGSEGLPHVCTEGNPGMASGGMGDVLTGVLAGLMAQWLNPLDAALLGVRLHGAAGDWAARSGERGLLAGDLMEPLRLLANR